MSTHLVPLLDDGALDGITGLRSLLTDAIRAPDAVTYSGGNAVYTFTPDLTANEATVFAACVRAARARLFSRADWQSIQDDVDGLRTYVGLASPTNAQSVAAIKALIKVLRALFRD